MSEHVLIVDDEHAVRELLISQVSYMGYPCSGAGSAQEALKIASENPHPALVLSDLQMPDFSGLELLRRLRDLDENIQVVMVTANDNLDTVRQCLREGAYDYLVKPFDLEELAKTVERAIERRRLKAQVDEYQRHLERKVREQTQEIQDTRDIALQTLAKLAECRDDDTGYHLERMASYSRVLVEALRSGPYKKIVTVEFVDHLFKSSPLHDIGKVAIPDSILRKPGPLTPEEQAIMKTHTTIGGDTLRNVVEKYRTPTTEGARFLKVAMEIAYNHHERWDGRGYPQSKSGDGIPLEARIVALADAYDAITSDRPYKLAHDHQEGVRRITIDRDKHFDPVVVDAFMECEKSFEEIQQEMKDGRALAASSAAVRKF